MTELVLELRQLHPAQQSIVDSPARFKVVCCGRRWGKTELASDLALNWMLDGLSVAYFSLTYRNVDEFWNRIKGDAQPVMLDKNENKMTMNLITGGMIECWSLQKGDSARGRHYDRIIVDEAAIIPKLDYLWTQVLRAMLADTRGHCIFFSTPRGFNYFHKLYVMGIDDKIGDWDGWNYPTASNPHINPDEIESIHESIPDRAYREEYLAEFIEDGGVFRGVNEVSVLEPQNPTANKLYIYGVDWAKSYDFTVISILDPETKQQVYLDRFNKISWELQRGRLQALCERYPPKVIWAEVNSIGEPQIEALQGLGLPVQPFYTSPSSKQPLIDSLSLAIEKQDITLLDDMIQRNELLSYQMVRMPGGGFKYSAPDGAHDDTVIALALAWYGLSHLPSPAIIRKPVKGLYERRNPNMRRLR